MDTVLLDTNIVSFFFKKDSRAAGQPISPQDAWIAATGLHYHIPLVTHNPSDFEMVQGLTIITTIT